MILVLAFLHLQKFLLRILVSEMQRLFLTTILINFNLLQHKGILKKISCVK
uniref:Uncharacterized protein n=1 Tax=Iridovirus sp. TaxID=135728 RepID=A0AAU7YE49_9VIRU